MAGYTKLFNSILASTVWREDDKTRIVWITMLAMADRNGVVEGSIPGLADLARVSIADCEQALLTLQTPDQYSRSKDADGRRIAVIEGGWLLINHSKYRVKMDQDQRREYLKLKQREYRRRQQPVNKRKHVSTLVNTVNDVHTTSTNTNTNTKEKKIVPSINKQSTYISLSSNSTREDVKAKAISVSGLQKPENGFYLDERFTEFEQAYPLQRRGGGDRARRAFWKVLQDASGRMDKFTAMMTALLQHQRSTQWRDGFIPTMTNWLERELWKQVLPEPEDEAARVRALNQAAFDARNKPKAKS